MKDDVKDLIKDQFIKYASYVIKDRAIPHIDDGLKPVQRRIMWTLFGIDDGKLHKVANVAGQTMALHPHGDQAIVDALVNLSNKGFLLDQQGNFGNIFTGDPAAASRYIETRLSQLAKETVFNRELTFFTPSYDGRRQEPITLPAKIPLVLMQGVDGIAVGMATHIFPHNFIELLQAQIAILENKPYEILPDFPTGGYMDASAYDQGRGKVKLRAKIDVDDAKTIVIRQICYGTTTESLIRSIDEAAKKGRLKIDAIHDYTTSHPEIEIKLPRGIYANEVIDALYHYTDCEVTLSSNITVIKDNLPWEGGVNEILEYLTQKLQEYLEKELIFEKNRLEEKIFFKTLEQIFIENKMYKKIETLKTNEAIHQSVEKSFQPFHANLLRIPTFEDREKLLNLPIRRISRFDIDKNEEEIAALLAHLKEVDKDLKQIKQVAIRYLKALIKKYKSHFPRKTEVGEIEELDRRAIKTVEVKVGYDEKSGFLGLKVSGTHKVSCTNFDRLLLMFDDGSYKIISIPEKIYINVQHRKLIYLGVADKKTTFSALYRDPKTKIAFAKRFVIKQFILDKEYRFFEEGMEGLLLTTLDSPKVAIQFMPKPKQKLKKISFDFEEVLLKGVGAKGVRVASRAVKKVALNGEIPDDQLELFV